MTLAIGMNSGSSFDGIDVVLVELNEDEAGNPTRPTFISGQSYDWPERVAGLVLRAFENELSIFELMRLNYVAGAVYAESVRTFMREANLGPGDVEVIGYDGQTIYQEPADRAAMKDFADGEDLIGRWLDGPYPVGMQIAEPAIVAVAVDTPVVTHFRPMDHALGGNGAPLMQYLDWVSFRDLGPILTLNIGGIANCHLVDPDRSRMLAFDTGPGNVMIDHIMRVKFGREYDTDGATARTGTVDDAMLSRLKEHDYFKRPIPRSAWRLDFGSSYADAIIAEFGHVTPEDMLATVTEFTAYATSRSIFDNVPAITECSVIMASGGGTRNGFLMERLASYMPSYIRLTMTDEFGIPAAFKEAVKFAVLGHATLNSIANNIPAACGAERFGVLGKINLPPRVAKI